MLGSGSRNGRHLGWALTLAVVLGAAACGGGDEPGGGGGDGGPDAAADAGTDGSATDGSTTDGSTTDGSAADGSAGTPCTTGADCNDLNPCNGMEACIDGTCTAGTPPDDGTTCEADDDPTTRDLCVGGLCAPTRCGDGYLDADNDEQCDDGNDVDGDGCDNDCTFSCTEDADCDDGNECNGQESCNADTHQCEAGTPLDDGTDCADGAGSCFGGICGPRACTEDADCDDGNECNGTESCTAGRCAAGTPLDCDDGDACTADTCVPGGGCVNVLIDGDGDGQAATTLGACGTDCNDGRSDIYDGAPEICDGVDNDCDGMVDEDSLVTWYVDCDGDGSAAAGAASMESCSRPPVSMTGCVGGGGSWTVTPPGEGTTDCNDANPLVVPGQSRWFDTPIPGAPMDVDYDYDCNGVEEPEREEGGCTASFFACTALPGFLGDVPACGEDGRIATACAWSRRQGRCVPTETDTVTQRCH